MVIDKTRGSSTKSLMEKLSKIATAIDSATKNGSNNKGNGEIDASFECHGICDKLLDNFKTRHVFFV